MSNQGIGECLFVVEPRRGDREKCHCQNCVAWRIKHGCPEPGAATADALYGDVGQKPRMGLASLLTEEEHAKMMQEIAEDTEPPVALTDQHVRALETAIRAEGYIILTDPETGEIKLERGK